MNIAEVAALRERAGVLEISQAEWQAFDRARLSDALAFYLQLRSALRQEWTEQRPFSLPATKLAAEEFLPQRRDRKLYLRLTKELIRLGLIERVMVAGFSNGRRTAALFMFKACRLPTTTIRSQSKILFLDHHRRRCP